MKKLKPGEARSVTVRAWHCQCTRCGREWLATPREPDGELDVPARCVRCKSPYWRDERGLRPRGRPPKPKE